MADNIDGFSKIVFSLEVDDNETGIKASGINFTLHDSIYDLYPTAKMSLTDYTGTFNEYMGFVNGTKVTIRFGRNEETWKKCSYRVIKNSTPQQNTQNGIGGNIELSLLHDYSNFQNKVSESYNSNISDIIKSKTNNYSFDYVNINPTLNSGLWLQPYITDSDFMINHLLPFAYSTDSDNSPYYCFIDSNNGFNFRNYKRLFLQNNYRVLEYKSGGTIESLATNTITSINFAQVSLSDIKPFYNRITTYFDENGEYYKNGSPTLITDFPNSATDPIPVKANLDYITGVECLLDDDILLEDTKNNRLGFIANSVKDCISPDKVIITMNLDRGLCSGKKVRINLPTTSSNSSNELSLRCSGDYLIESSYHKWNGRNAITILVCSKQIIKVTNEYRNIALVVNR